jgi:hypothetical protein
MMEEGLERIVGEVLGSEFVTSCFESSGIVLAPGTALQSQNVQPHPGHLDMVFSE